MKHLLTLCRSLAVVAAALVAVSASDAAEYHVSVDGDDSNAGTAASPFATLQRGHDCADPGDTVWVHGGTYLLTGNRPAGISLDKSGEPGKRIHFWACENELPIIDCSGLESPERPVGVRVTGSWLHLRGLEIRGTMAPRGTSYGVWIKDAANDVMERLSLHDHQGPGLFIDGGTGGHLVLNCDSYDNYDPHSTTGPGQNADGFGCHYQRRGTSTIFRGCRAWWNSDDGYDWFKQEVPVVIENCWAMGSGYTPGGAEFAASGNGAGFKMGNTFTGVRHVIRNCVSIRNKVQGFYANHSHGGSDWFNNTAYANRGAAFDMLSDIALSGTGVHRLRNNVASPATVRNSGASDMRHNSWDLGITVTDDDFVSVSDEGFLGTRKPDGDLPDIDFLKVRPGGRLSGQGVDVGLPYPGAAPDLGAAR